MLGHNGSERDGRGGRRSWSGKRSRPQHDLWRGREGAKTLRREARRSFPLIARIIADAGYQGRTMEAVVARTGVWERQIVRRCDRPRFGVLPKRWIVEVVFTQMTKADVLALGARGQHVADLDLGVGDDHAVDEQQHELPALLEGRRGQPVLHPRAERLQ